jgi:hypothetical protein
MFGDYSRRERLRDAMMTLAVGFIVLFGGRSLAEAFDPFGTVVFWIQAAVLFGIAMPWISLALARFLKA